MAVAYFLRDRLRFPPCAIHQKQFRHLFAGQLQRRRPPRAARSEQQNPRARQIEAQIFTQRARNCSGIGVESVGKNLPWRAKRGAWSVERGAWSVKGGALRRSDAPTLRRSTLHAWGARVEPVQ